MKTVLYSRKSTESEDRQVLSIESQIKELSDLAAREGLSIDKVITESKSAKAPGRPGFEELLRLIEKDKGVTLLCWKLDRLARNPIDGGKVAWYLQQGLIREIKTPERSYFPTDNVLMMTFELGMANQFVRDLSNNVKRGNKAKLEKGGWPGRAPFGYLNDKANHTILIDPVLAPLVSGMFNLFASGGYSLKQIATITREKAPLNCPLIHTSLVYRIISNPFYTGLMLRSGKIYQGSHSPIVSKVIFDNCQQLLNPNRSRKQKHLFSLRGFLTCGKCGCALTATTKKGHQYYYCTNGKKVCDQHCKYIKAELLHQQVAEQLRAIQVDKELIEIMYQAAREKHHSEQDIKAKTLEQIKSQLETQKTKQAKLLDLLLAEKISQEVYDSKNEILKREQVALQNQYSQLLKKQTEGNSTLELIKNAFLTANYAENDFLEAHEEKKRSLAEKLLWNLKVLNQKIVECRLKQPFQIMLEANQKELSFESSFWQGR